MDDDQPLDPETMEILRRQTEKRRTHADFFDWYDRSALGKGIAEQGIVSSLFSAMAKKGQSVYSSPVPSLDEWPDCWAKDASGDRVAVEVSELVDEGALPAGEPRPWEAARIRASLQEIISRKDARTMGMSGARDAILVIHTDELYLTPTFVLESIGTTPFRLPHGNIARTFLLFSYDPWLQDYPFLELSLAS